ncbi:MULTISPECIES: extracellular solute-binding protein [Aphanothece]|uniref:extracellular solute-binding protein n=1 Tax=Aphanothece TaxID=1121 RepID=UPI003984976F
MAIPHPPRQASPSTTSRRHRPGRAGATLAATTGLLLLSALAGCTPGNGRLEGGLHTIVYVAIGVERAPDLASELERQKQLRERFSHLQRSFREVRPGVHLEVLVFDRDRFVEEIRRRTHSGLGPDLMLVDGLTAETLHQNQLVTAIAVPNPSSELVRTELIPYVRSAPHQWFGLPVGQEPQLACFDRRRMAQAPETLSALMEASSRGQSIGLTLDLGNLAWTMGSLGALESIAQVRRGAAATPERIQAIQNWLGWLRNADLQQRISFAGSQGELVEGLRTGRFDWIHCRSQDASLLRKELGSHLALAPLPSGPGGAASPISTVRMWTFGRNSSPRQRNVAKALARFTLNPPVQRAFTIQTQGLLPVSRGATLPVASSANLAALLAAQRQASEAQNLTEELIALRTEKNALNKILTQFRYGELDSASATDALIKILRQKPHE